MWIGTIITMPELPLQNKKRVEKQDRLLSKDYVLLMFSSFASAMMNHFFLSAMPLYVAFLGGSTFQAGLFVTFYAMAALIVRPTSGMLSDKYGRVKLLIFSAALCSAHCIFYGLTASIPLLLMLRLVGGAGFGVHSTCANAAAADVVPKSRLAEGIGYFTLYGTVAQAIGPGIAIAIVAGDTLGDYKALFYFSAALCAAGTITNSLITYERKRRKHETRIGGAASETKEMPHEPMPSAPGAPLPKTFLGFEYAVFAPMAVIILINIGIAGILAFLATFSRWKGFGNPALFFAISAAGILISRLFFGKLVDKRGSDIVIIPGIIILAAGLSVLPVVGSRAVLFVLAFPLGLAQGALLPTLNAMIFRRCSAARRGTAAGAYFTALDIGYAISAPLLGALADALDFRFIYWASSLYVAIALVAYLLICSDKRYNARNLTRF